MSTTLSDGTKYRDATIDGQKIYTILASPKNPSAVGKQLDASNFSAFTKGNSFSYYTPKTTTTTSTSTPAPAATNTGVWYTKDGINYGYDGKPLNAPTTTTTAPATSSPAPTTVAGYRIASVSDYDAAMAQAQAKVQAAAAKVNPMDPTSFLALSQAQAELSLVQATQGKWTPAPTQSAPAPTQTSTSTPTTSGTKNDYSTRKFAPTYDSLGNVTGGQWLDELGNVVGTYNPATDIAPTAAQTVKSSVPATTAQTGASLYPNNPKAAAAYDKAIREGQSLVGQTRTAEQNVTMAKDAANFWVNNPLAPAEAWMNDFLTGNPVGQAAAPVLAGGVPVGTIGGSAGPSSPLDVDGIIDGAVSSYQNNQTSPIPTNPTGTYNGAPGTTPVVNSPMANGTASGPSPTWGTNTNTPAPGTTAATGTPSGTTTATGTGATSTQTPGAGGIDPAVLAGAGAVISAGGSVIGGQTQANAATEAAKLQNEQFNKWLELQKQAQTQQQNNAQPWLDAGKGALNQLGSFFTDNPDFGMTQFQADPGYSFRLSEGMKALQNSAAARGGLLSGNTMKGITEYGQGMASQEYQNAYNRYNQNRNTKLNALQSTAGLGQTAVSQSNQASQNYTQGAGQAMTGGANALANGMNSAASANASGYVGASNALTDALSGYLQFNQNQNFLNALKGG